MRGTYEFVLRAGKKPSPNARLVYRAVPRFGSSVPIRVRRLKDGIAVGFDASRAVAIETQFFVGWRPVKRAARAAHLRVRLRELLVRRAMDPGCGTLPCPSQDESTRLGQNTTAPGEWNVYVDVGGIWAPWRPILIRPRTGERIRSRQTIDLYVPRGKPWRLFVQTRECDFGLGNAYSPQGQVVPCPRLEDEVGSLVGDDVPGTLAVRFRSPAASLGTHRVNSSRDASTCPPSNRQGCFRLTFTVSRMRR